jgi:hypothetical protein
VTGVDCRVVVAEAGGAADQQAPAAGRTHVAEHDRLAATSKPLI